MVEGEGVMAKYEVQKLFRLTKKLNKKLEQLIEINKRHNDRVGFEDRPATQKDYFAKVIGDDLRKRGL
jgi:hypothetical protein